jgi:hypothetical protein
VTFLPLAPEEKPDTGGVSGQHSANLALQPTRMQLELFRFKEAGLTLDVRNADLIVSHAGERVWKVVWSC